MGVATMERCSLVQAQFVGTKMEYTIFSFADLRGAAFARCDGKFANFVGAEIARARAEKCSFLGADFFWTAFEQMQFIDCEMEAIRKPDVVRTAFGPSVKPPPVELQSLAPAAPPERRGR